MKSQRKESTWSIQRPWEHLCWSLGKKQHAVSLEMEAADRTCEALKVTTSILYFIASALGNH